MKTILVALAALALPTAAAVAQNTTAEAGENARSESSQERRASEERSEERQVCRRLRTSNSHRAERVCMTREQWRDYNR